MSDVTEATQDVLDAVSKLNVIDVKLDDLKAKIDALLVGQLEATELAALKAAVADLKTVSTSVEAEATELAGSEAPTE